MDKKEWPWKAMTRQDKLLLALTLTASLAAPFAADIIMPVAHAEEPAAVQVVDKPVMGIPITEDIPADSPVELWSIEPEPMEPNYDYIPLDKPLAEALVDSCEECNVPLELALGVMEVESGFQVDAVGPDGHDFGLFQIRDSNHAWLIGETGADPMAPEGNICCGVWMLSYLLERYGNQSSALTAYRYGHDNGSRTYANNVLATAERWSNL